MEGSARSTHKCCVGSNQCWAGIQLIFHARTDSKRKRVKKFPIKSFAKFNGTKKGVNCKFVALNTDFFSKF
jgi:hypothetical protein